MNRLSNAGDKLYEAILFFFVKFVFAIGVVAAWKGAYATAMVLVPQFASNDLVGTLVSLAIFGGFLKAMRASPSCGWEWYFYAFAYGPLNFFGEASYWLGWLYMAPGRLARHVFNAGRPSV